MGTIHITEHELVLITTALDFSCHVLAGCDMEKSKLAEIEDLRRRLHMEWVEDDDHD